MHSLDEVSASGAVGPQPASRSVKTVAVSCTTAAVVELWDSIGNTAAVGAVRKLTVDCPATDTRTVRLQSSAFPQGIYVNIVSGTGVRVSVEHGI